jgi:hypothetical protein
LPLRYNAVALSSVESDVYIIPLIDESLFISHEVHLEPVYTVEVQEDVVFVPALIVEDYKL